MKTTRKIVVLTILLFSFMMIYTPYSTEPDPIGDSDLIQRNDGGVPNGVEKVLQSSNSPQVSPTEITGNSTSFRVNETNWRSGSDHGTINGRDGGTVGNFNITDIPTGFNGIYTNVTLDNVSFAPKNITAQTTSEKGLVANEEYPSLAQVFRVDGGVGNQFTITKFIANLTGFTEDENCTLFIYNKSSSDPEPDTNITKGYTLYGDSDDTKLDVFTFPIDELPVLQTNKDYYIVLNWTGEKLQEKQFIWQYNTNTPSFGQLMWLDNETGWEVGSNVECVMSLEIDPINLTTDFTNIKAKLNEGTERDLTKIKDGKAFFNTTDLIAPDPFGNIVINITTDNDWEMQFDYEYDFISASGTGRSIQPKENDWMWKSIPDEYRLEYTFGYLEKYSSGMTEWKVNVGNLDIGSGNNSFLLNTPQDWDITDVSETYELIQLPTGSVFRLADGSYTNVKVNATDIDRISEIDSDTKYFNFYQNWESAYFDLDVTTNSIGNVSFYLLDPDDQQVHTDNESDVSGTTQFEYTFDASDKRDNYTAVAIYHNGTSVHSARCMIPYRYKIALKDGGQFAKSMVITNSSDSPEESIYGDGVWYVKDDIQYDLEIQWEGETATYDNIIFSENKVIIPFYNIKIDVNVRDKYNMNADGYSVKVFSGGTEIATKQVNSNGIAPFTITELVEVGELVFRLYRPNGSRIYGFDEYTYDWSGVDTDGNDIDQRKMDSTDNEFKEGDYVNSDLGYLNFKLDDIDTSTPISDDSEPNDLVGNAHHLTNGTYHYQTNSTDVDHYNITIKEGNQVKIDLDFVDYRGNIDANLTDQDGNVVAFGNSTTNDETIRYNATETANYTLKVFRIGGGQNYQDYSITVNDNYETGSPSADDGDDNGKTINPNRLTWEQIIWFGIFLLVSLIALGIFYKVRKYKKSHPKTKVKRKKEMKGIEESEVEEDPMEASLKEKREVTRYFDDVTGMHGVLLVHKETGTCLSKASYLLGHGLNEDLITGFMTAFGNIKHEIGSQMGMTTNDRKKPEVMEWDEFTGTLIDGALATLIIIADNRIGNTLQSRATQLLDHYESSHFEDLKYKPEQMKLFRDFPKEVDEELDGDLNKLCGVDPFQLTKAEGSKDVKKVLWGLEKMGESFKPAKIPSILMRELGMDELDAKYWTYVMYSFLVFKPLERED